MKINAQILLGAKGEWAVFGRISTFTAKGATQHKVEMVFERDNNARVNDFTTGWSLEEIAALHDKLIKWARSEGELV